MKTINLLKLKSNQIIKSSKFFNLYSKASFNFKSRTIGSNFQTFKLEGEIAVV